MIPIGAELRSRGVGCRLGFFLHIPFPPYDVFRALPERRSLLQTFLAYDLIGFQTPLDARHFADALARDLGASVDLTAGRAELNGQVVTFDAFLIGIDVAGTSHTALTNRFSGRPARGIVNRIMRELGPIGDDVEAFPRASIALAPLRAAAEAQGRDDFTSLWSGQNASGCREIPAADLLRELAARVPG